MSELSVETITAQLFRIVVFEDEDKKFILKHFIKFYLGRYTDCNNLKAAISKVYPQYIEVMEKCLLLK